MITEEDFEAWRGSPVTEAVLAAVQALGDGAKEEWVKATWDNGNVDPVMLAALKVKEQVCLDLVGITLKDIEEWAR